MRMQCKVLPLLLLALALAAQPASCLRYEVTVVLGTSAFQPMDGSLKLQIKTSDGGEELVEIQPRELLRRSGRYSAMVDLRCRVESIVAASFRWTLRPPYAVWYLLWRPSILLSRVELYPIYIADRMHRLIEQIRFEPDDQRRELSLQHNQRYTFHKPISMVDLFNLR